jgi:hypothetical protein
MTLARAFGQLSNSSRSVKRVGGVDVVVVVANVGAFALVIVIGDGEIGRDSFVVIDVVVTVVVDDDDEGDGESGCDVIGCVAEVDGVRWLNDVDGDSDCARVLVAVHAMIIETQRISFRSYNRIISNQRP